MTQTNEIDHLEEDAQRTREQLTHTVDALRGRITNAVSPSVVTRDLQNYLLTKARDNPLQAAGLAAGLAFPLSRLLASIPAPILLVGAGIALSKTDVKSVGSTSAQDFAQRTSQAATAAIGSVSQTVDDLRSGSSDALDTASESLASTVQEISDTFQQYPLVLGAIGLAVGALIGGAVPISRMEREALGEMSDDLKRQATSLASDGLEAAKDAAGQVYAGAAEEASSKKKL